MKEAWNYNQCMSVLTGEIELLKKISAAQDKVRKAVMHREWEDFDEKNLELNHLAGEFSRLEDERVRHFSLLINRESSSQGSMDNENEENEMAENTFYTAIMGLPSGERVELSRLYRELKMETLKMRALNETFLVYLNEARSLTASYLETVCPARGGKLYTNKGHKVSQDLRSIVFNSRF